MTIETGNITLTDYDFLLDLHRTGKLESFTLESLKQSYSTSVGDPHDNSTFVLFLQFIREVTLHKAFDPMISNRMLWEFVNGTDFAFAALVLENYWVRLEYMAKHPTKNCKNDPNMPKTIYTEGTNGEGASKSGGWCDAGLERFDDLVELFDKREEDAKSAGKNSFDAKFLAMKKTAATQKPKSRKMATKDRTYNFLTRPASKRKRSIVDPGGFPPPTPTNKLHPGGEKGVV